MDDKLTNALLLCFDKSPEDAVAYMTSQGFDITWDWEEALESIKKHCFTVSKVNSADVLQLLHDELNKAMEEGMSYNDFVKSAPKTLQNKGFALKDDGSAFRYDLIYQMNMQTAYQNGQFWEMEAANDEFPYRQFVAIDDNRTTSGCNELDDVIVHHKSTTYLTNQTPRHFRCRSTWISVTESQAEGKSKTDEELEDIKPEKGFGLNPKEAEYKPNLGKYAPAIQNKLKEALK